MRVIGLTGSIGMGKSTAAGMLRRMGIPVHDADAAVHRLFAKGGAAVGPVGAAFPGVVVNGAVDRLRLGPLVLGDPAALRRLEAIVHPLVRRAERCFLFQAARRRCPVAVVDIPLLFETGAVRRLDAVMVVSAPKAVQRARVLRRSGMTPEKLDAVLARQLADHEKRRRADVVIPSGQGRRVTQQALTRFLRRVERYPAVSWPPGRWRSEGRKSSHA